MTNIMVELACNQHDFERFRIKVVKRFNMPRDMITLRLSKRPTLGEIKCIYVGRDVDVGEIEQYIRKYFEQKGLIERIITMRVIY